MNIDLTPILQAVIALLAALVTYKLIPWIKARTTSEQQTMLRATIKTLVFAAEQFFGAGTGEQKLDWVVQQLEKRGYTADRVEIEAIIKENLEALHLVKVDNGTDEEQQDGEHDGEDEEAAEAVDKPPEE